MRPTVQALKLLARLGVVDAEIVLPFRTSVLEHPVFLRALTTDISAFSQIILQTEFANLDITDPSVIVDCGANVGSASVYFLNRWPQVRVIAVEADPSNYPLLVRNLAPYGERAMPVLGAVSDHDGYVSIERTAGSHWSSRITNNIECSGTIVPSFTLDTIRAWVPGSRFDLIKMDIEGAETAVMHQMQTRNWNGTRLVVELHNEAAKHQFDLLAIQSGGQQLNFGEYHSLVL
jgi:FkbM family methyltransferase